jgi:hypothetical protein
MSQAALHPLPPDVLDEPESTELHMSSTAHQTPTDPPTTPTVPPDSISI